MISNLVGVAISTTGDPHRLDALARCAQAWDSVLANLTPAAELFVTVDGDRDAVIRATSAVAEYANDVYQVGEPLLDSYGRHTGDKYMRDGRFGVAVNKNTGIELLMDAGVEHLFLSDDDTWPHTHYAIKEHIAPEMPGHSMVCWGKHRLGMKGKYTASWGWPRGVMLYASRSVVEKVGGMDERFGPGGHEHVEWSRRIHQHGFTPVPYPTPVIYAEDQGTRARAFWHAEDMRRPGEPLGDHRLRKSRFTSVRRQDGDWPAIEKIMAERDGDTSFVPYTARDNGRASATLFQNL